MEKTGWVGRKQKVIFYGDFCSVHENEMCSCHMSVLPQLTANIRKLLLKCGNNEKEGDGKLNDVLLVIWQEHLLSVIKNFR